MDEICLSHKTVSTAIFEYLEKRGKKPNRKKGIRPHYSNSNFECWISVKKDKK